MRIAQAGKIRFYGASITVQGYESVNYILCIFCDHFLTFSDSISTMLLTMDLKMISLRKKMSAAKK